MLPQNVRVLKSIQFLLALLLLAGCATTRRETAPPDWEGTNAAPVAPPKPSKPATPSMTPPPAPTNQVSRLTPVWIPLELWTRSNGLRSPVRIPAGTQASYAITTPRGVLAVKTGSRQAHWDGIGLQLGYAPVETNGHLFVNSLDAQKNFQPLLAALPLPDHTNRVVVIDPGHGGINTGAKSLVGGRFEKEFTLDWAKRLTPLLRSNGWTVLLTRTNDTDVSLSNRVAFAEAHHADLFLSLHFNSAGPNPEPNGLETYCLTPTGMPSTLTREFEDDASLVFPNNSFDEQNIQYAARLHRALLAVNGTPDRSVCHARFMGVLRGQKRPAVLLEGGYLSNPREARHIADPAFRQKLAQAVANALQ